MPQITQQELISILEAMDAARFHRALTNLGNNDTASEVRGLAEVALSEQRDQLFKLIISSRHIFTLATASSDNSAAHEVKRFVEAFSEQFNELGIALSDDATVAEAWLAVEERSQQLYTGGKRGAAVPEKNLQNSAQVIQRFFRREKQGAFRFNPHRHVKIWISSNKDVFMNAENQLRLVRMRANCPGDEITLIYDSRMLSEASLLDLSKFCSTNGIAAIDVLSIQPICQKNEDEVKLLDIYADQINHLGKGGNLAQASDVLRVLRVVLAMGVYSDLDVDVVTRHLPKAIRVFGDILLNIGSSLQKKNGLETLHASNDIIAVTDLTSEKISIIQKYIIEANKPKSVNAIVHTLLANEQDYAYLEDYCSSFYNELTPRQFRNNLVRIITGMEQGREDLILESMFDNIDEDDDASISDTYPAINKVADRRMLYRRSVVCSSGPSAVLNLFIKDRRIFTTEYVNLSVAPCSLNSYKQLHSAFRSPMALALHAPSLGDVSRTGSYGDLSWTAPGRDTIRDREKEYTKAATKIQGALRAASEPEAARTLISHKKK